MTGRWWQVLATLRDQFGSDTDVRDLEQFLMGEGLDGQEIGEVLTLYFADVLGAPVAPGGRPTSLRVQGPHERGRFATDAWGYLVSLHESGVVSVFDFEQLVERALVFMDGRIGLAEIRALADEQGLDTAARAADRTLLH
jgi:uncharacterized protein Smg (DUF494 family)